MRMAAEQKKTEIAKLVIRICGTKGNNCRGLDKVEDALKLLALDGINAEDARIYEIPIDWDNQVLIMFEYKGKDYEALFGIEAETNRVYGGEYSENIFDKYGEIFEQIPIDVEDLKTRRTAEEVKEEIKSLFEDDAELFADCIEELDSYNGYLGDDRYYEMSDLDEIYHNEDPTEILTRAFYGYDADSCVIDKYGSKHYEAFNPNRDFFCFNGYGNLVSSDWKDYSAHLDDYVINEMSENRHYIYSIADDDRLEALFDELEECEE